VYIDEQIDRGLPEQSHKFGDRARRMAYREDCRHRLGLSHSFLRPFTSSRKNEDQGKGNQAQRASEHVTNNMLN
jgi:hypothetical protein